MLWLRFPGHVDIPRFVKQAGVQLKSFEELEQEDTSTSILVHVVYSTDQAPRAVIHDPTDSVFVPVNVSGLSVSVPYLLPRVLVVEMLAALSPTQQPGDLSPKKKKKKPGQS
jgi:hypothetical protein